jgi:two-component system chemotaxis response regulator CheY
MKVLIVDDSKTMLKINSNVVKGLGIEDILTAENGQEALGIYKDNQDIDLVLLDVNMPVMNGFQFLERIKKVKPEIKVFMCTTEGGREEVIKALRLGANNYIVKPINRENLEQKIKEVMEK